MFARYKAEDMGAVYFPNKDVTLNGPRRQRFRLREFKRKQRVRRGRRA